MLTADIIYFIETNHFIPIKDNCNTDEAKNINDTLIKYRKSKKNNRETIILDSHIPFWRKITDSKNYNMALSLYHFNIYKNRLPCQVRPVNRKRTLDEEKEYKMACWLNGKKQKYKKNSENNPIYILLDSLIPHWNKTYKPEENAICNAKLVYNFWEKNKRMPKQSHSVDKEEYRLATWVNSQKLALKGKNILHKYNSVIDILKSIPDFIL